MSAARLEIRLLGRFELQVAGQPIRLASRPAQSLLAYLALTAGTLHRREKLAGMLWPEADETSARGYLRASLWRVRKALEAAGLSGDDFLLSDDITLGFKPGASYWLDALALEQAVAAGCPVEALIDAVGAYQGELLPGFYDDWVGPVRQRLQALFERRAQRLVECLVQQQRWAEAREWSEFTLARSPAAEWAYRALMQACAATHDSAGLAAAYERCRAALHAELGVEPAEATQALHAQLQLSLQAGGVGPASAAPPVALPAPMTGFVGRAAELAEAGRLLQQAACRLLTLVGEGGAGKTRLALEVAAQAAGTGAYRHGVFFVPLAPLNHAEYIVSAIARSLEFKFDGPSEPARQLRRYLADRQLLLVLDDFEHLLPSGAARLVTELLAAAPGLKLLVTSRERLSLQAEWLLEVHGLAVPIGDDEAGAERYSGVQLFLQSAERAWPGARGPLTEADRRSALRICRLVAGLPLALELAAAWVRVLSFQEIAAEIEKDLGFLAADRLDLTDRHRSLQVVFDHSWRLLPEAEQMVVRQLSVFRGGFTREAAESVAGATLAQLSACVDKSLLWRTGAGRYEMHELLRQYAQSRLSEAGEAEAVCRRHRDYCRALLSSESTFVWGAVDVAMLRRVEAEQGNLSAALAWSKAHDEPQAHLSLVVAMTWFWFVRADYAEGRKWLEAALQAGPDAAPEAASFAGALAEQQGDYQAAEALLQTALALSHEPWQPEYMWTLLHLGRVALLQGEFQRAVDLYAEALELYRRGGFQFGTANGLMYMGVALFYQGHDERAQAVLEESLPLLRELNDVWALARALHGLGLVALRRGQVTHALDLLGESLRLAVERRDRAHVAECLEALAWAAGARKQPERAARLLGAAEALRRQVGLLRPPGLRDEFERNARLIHRQLSDAAYAQAWGQGLSLDEEQALALAAAEQSA